MAPTDDLEVTREELQNEAEALAREVLHTSAAEAWRRVRDEGLYEGSFFAVRLGQIFFLLGEHEPDGGARASRPAEPPYQVAAE